MPNKQKRNAFFFFMLDFKKREEAQGRKFPYGLKDVQCDPKCSEAWQTMTRQQKGHYESLAQDSKIAAQVPRDKKTCTGESVAELKRLDKEERVFVQTMTAYIMSRIPEDSDPYEFSAVKFFLIHANYFCGQQVGKSTFDYYPAEFAVLEFSLADGVGDVYHEIINTKVPIGYTREAMETSQYIHRIPIEFAGGESDYLLMYNKLVAFLKQRTEGTEFPPLFATDSVTPKVLSLLQRMTDAAGVERDTFLVYSMDMLFNQYVNAACSNKSTGESFKIPLPVAKLQLEKDPYGYVTGLECDFHHNLETTLLHCSMSVVKRWGYAVCDWCCESLHIEMIVGKHFPEKKRSEETNLAESLSQLDVCNVEPAYSVLSMSGVSEEHRIKKSERTYQEEQARRKASKPVSITDHSKKHGISEVYYPTAMPIYQRPLRIPKTQSRAMSGMHNVFGDDKKDKDFPPLGREARRGNK